MASIVRVSRRPGERTGAAVEVSCAIDWKKPVNGLLRGLIVKGARDSLKRSYEKFTAMCARELAERSPAETARATRRGARAFRRGRARSTDAFPVEGALSTEASFSTSALDARDRHDARRTRTCLHSRSPSSTKARARAQAEKRAVNPPAPPRKPPTTRASAPPPTRVG